mgnify:CR=1 FL=1
MKKTITLLLALTLALSFTFVLTSCDLFDDDDDYVVTEQESTQVQDQDIISEDKALDIALAKVEGATKDDLMHINLDVDDGRKVYDVSIFYDKMEYEFEIDAVTGDILEYDVDRD